MAAQNQEALNKGMQNMSSGKILSNTTKGGL